MLFPLAIACLLVLFVRILLGLRYTYWSSQGTPLEKPTLFFGNLLPVAFQQTSFVELLQEIYTKNADKRYVGIYEFLKPVLVLRDLDLIKQIWVTEFTSFPERVSVTSGTADPLWSKYPFAMPGGPEWKGLRMTFNRIYTPSNLKMMFGLISYTVQQFVGHLADDGPFLKLEMKNAFIKVTNDVIATTALGFCCDSMADPENELLRMGKEISNFRGIMNTLKIFVSSKIPRLAKLLRIHIISKPVAKYFTKVIGDALKEREQGGAIRPDLLHLMLQARSGRLKDDSSSSLTSSPPHFATISQWNDPDVEHCETTITDEIITAQATMFFLGGYDNVSTCMSYAAYELAVNPKVQARLRDEVDKTLRKYNGEVCHEALLNMQYMDLVISEVLRKWPPFGSIYRKVSRRYVIEPTREGEKAVVLEPGVSCQIPIYSIHRDPNYYPNPDKFRPDRFKKLIHSNAFLPFGLGPRSCLGYRFALLEVKIVIFHLLSKFHIVTVRETQVPLVMSARNMNPFPEYGFWLGLKRRR